MSIFCRRTGGNAWRVYMILSVFVFWLILSGKITVEIAVTGAVFSAVVFLFARFFLSWDLKRELTVYKMIPLAAAYFFTLAFEIFKANLSVIPYIIGAKKPSGVVVRFETELKSEMANVLLANSITLTPGTITLDQKNNSFTVHCLHEDMSHGMDTSVFVRLLTRMEKILKKGEKK